MKGAFLRYLPRGRRRGQIPLSTQFPPQVSSFGRSYAPARAPIVDRGRSGGTPYDQIHERRKRRGCSREDSKEVLKARPVSLGGEGEGATLLRATP